MKTLLFIIISIIIGLLAINIVYAEPLYCPESNNVENYREYLCKQPPTGCAYGDSIPIDSPKCAPSDEEVKQQQLTKQTFDEQTRQQSITGK
jgi:hypothetical protein